MNEDDLVSYRQYKINTNEMHQEGEKHIVSYLFIHSILYSNFSLFPCT